LPKKRDHTKDVSLLSDTSAITRGKNPCFIQGSGKKALQGRSEGSKNPIANRGEEKNAEKKKKRAKSRLLVLRKRSPSGKGEKIKNACLY